MRADRVQPRTRISQRMSVALDFFKADREHPELMRALRAYDPQLVLYYNKSACLWAIAHASSNGVFHVQNWTWPDGSYRSPSSYMLTYLRECDLWKSGFKDADRMCEHEEYDDELRNRKTGNDFDDDIDYLSRSNRRQQQRLKDLLCSL